MGELFTQLEVELADDALGYFHCNQRALLRLSASLPSGILTDLTKEVD